MPRVRLNPPPAVDIETPDAPAIEALETSGATSGTSRTSHQLASGASRRGKRPKRCTVRKTLKLSPQHAQMLDELAAAWGLPGCQVLKRLLLRAHLDMKGER